MHVPDRHPVFALSLRYVLLYVWTLFYTIHLAVDPAQFYTYYTQWSHTAVLLFMIMAVVSFTMPGLRAWVLAGWYPPTLAWVVQVYFAIQIVLLGGSTALEEAETEHGISRNEVLVGEKLMHAFPVFLMIIATFTERRAISSALSGFVGRSRVFLYAWWFFWATVPSTVFILAFDPEKRYSASIQWGVLIPVALLITYGVLGLVVLM